MSKRGENIRKRKDGRWEARIRVVSASDGKLKIKSLYGKTYSAVKNKVKDYYSNTKEQNFEPERDAGPVFQEIARQWLNQVRETRKYATYVKYQSVYEKYLKDSLSGISLSEISQTLITARLEMGSPEQGILSASIQKSISCVLNQILKYGRDHYGLHEEKITFQIKKNPNTPIDILSEGEQARLLKTVYHHMDICKLGILLCLSTGLRLGEICALRWTDIDLKGNILTVSRTVQRISSEDQPSRTELRIGEPKSIFSNRKIPLPDELAELLKQFWTGELYVLKGSRPMEPRTYQNIFARLLEQSEIRYRNFHILRHTFATNCVNHGVDAKSLSEILGHSDVKITLNRYVHPSLETKRGHLNCLVFNYGQMRGQAEGQKIKEYLETGEKSGVFAD